MEGTFVYSMGAETKKAECHLVWAQLGMCL